MEEGHIAIRPSHRSECRLLGGLHVLLKIKGDCREGKQGLGGG
jgi:hypothetical protein